MIAAKLYGKPNPKTNPLGLPAEWPSDMTIVTSKLPPGYDKLFKDMEEYEAYRTKHRPAYDAWEAAQPKP